MSTADDEPSEDDEPPDDVEPLSRWFARYDEALARGRTPPAPRPEDLGVDPSDLERFRAFLKRLGHTLGPPGAHAPATTIADGDEGRADAEVADMPRAVGRFRIDKELGRGGFGIVFRAFDPGMGRWVALKVPKAEALLDPGIRRRFLGEAHAAAQLDHPNLVPVFEAGEVGATCYIASSYCEGPTLWSWIEAGNTPVEPRLAARLVLAMTRAVEHMHARGFLHCDLKPGNVLLDLPPEGEADADPIPRITDFGLARLADAPVGESTAARAWGTPPYMAPEQIQQRREAVGAGADLYALGAILYELATGKPPHKADSTWKLMQAVVAEPPAPPRSLNRSLPRDLGAIAMKCLEKRPGRRYPSAAALADDLECFLGRRPTKARPLGPLRRLGRWPARNPAATAVLAMTLAFLGVSVRSSIALRRANERVEAALEQQKRANQEGRHQNYVMSLALANEEIRRGQWVQAQRRLRHVAPPPGSDEPDPRDFTWHYLWRQSRYDRTALDDLFPGGASELASGDGVLLGVDNSTRSGGLWRIVSDDTPKLATPRADMRFERPAAMSENLWNLQVSADGHKAAICRKQVNESFSTSIIDLESGRLMTEVDALLPRSFPTILSIDHGSLVMGTPGDRTSRILRQAFELDGRKMFQFVIPGTIQNGLSADGRRIAAARWVNHLESTAYLEIWDTWSEKVSASRPKELIRSIIATSTDPKGLIATGGLNGVVQLRGFTKGEVVSSLPPPPGNDDHPVYSLAYSPNGKLLAAGYNRRAVLWNVQDRTPAATLEGLEGRVEAITFVRGSDGDVALSAGSGEVIIWHRKPIEQAMSPGGHDDEVWGVAYVKGGRTLATLGGDHRLKLWDPWTGKEIKALEGHKGWPSCLAASTETPLLASGDFDGKVLIWDGEAGKLLHVLDAHEERVWAAAFSPDGSRLATVGRDRVVRLWDAPDWSPTATLTGHRADVRGVAFSPDGGELVTCGEDRSVIVWDARTGARLREWDGPMDATSLALSPDGLTLATGDVRGVLSLWDARTGKSRFLIPPLHRREITGLAFSPDGRVLAVAGQDSLMSLVDVRTGSLTLTLDGHEAGVNAVAFSPDGRTLASVSHDKTLRLWWAGPAPDEGGD